MHVVLARAADAAAECALGAVSAVLLLLVCALGCSIEAGGSALATFERLWRGLLEGEAALPIYMLGTSSWPVASLLAKWQAHCDATVMQKPQPAPGCAIPEVAEFSAGIQRATDSILLPTLFQAEEDGGIPPVLALGVFMQRILPALTTFLNGPHAEHLAVGCAGVAAALGALLVLLRLLGPPVSRDPLHGARLVELGAVAASLGLGELLMATPRAFAVVLAASVHLTWRSHRLFGEVPLAQVRRVLEMGSSQLLGGADTSSLAGGAAGGGLQDFTAQPGGPSPAAVAVGGLVQSLNADALARRRLWQAAASSEGLAVWWGQIARWLLSGEPSDELSSPSSVYLTMGFGGIEAIWLRSFLIRALDVGIPRLIFVTPDRGWLLVCEDVRRERAAEARILCLRTFTHFSRHYDHNNKAKFFLFPVLLSLGVDVAWLDIDIFVFKDPTPRLLQQRNEDPEQPKDVLVTDHFDEYCLNHGVFMVRASDRSLLWILEYIKWMHWYPYGHDQNGWDAFLGHSIIEPQLPDNLRTNPAINVSYGVLSTELEYVTLTGWAGDPHRQRGRALLLHFTTTQGITGRSKKQRLLALFNATSRRPGEDAPDRRRLQMATWKVLMSLRAGMPVMKRPCYEGIHEAVGQLIQSGLYEELLA